MKRKTFLVIALSAMGAMNAVSQQTLFDSPFVSDYESKSMPYRIPAIVRTVTETSNNDILVFADKRHGGGDVGQYNDNSDAINAHIDLTFRRSSNNGSTWDDEQTIIRGSETMGYGDVAVVSNWENPKEIVFFVAAGNVFFTSSSSSNRLRCFRFRSTDGGQNWTNKEFTDSLYSKVNYNGAFFSSGRICQSTQIKVGNYYRLYAALCVTGTNSIVLYSDDFGETWDVLAGNVTVPVSGGNEAKCEELPNGNVVVSSRVNNAGNRRFNVFSYTDKENAKGDWATSYTSGDLSVANKNSTNGEILILPAKDASGNKCKVVLQSMPYGKSSLWSSTRSHVSIYWKVLSTDDVTSASVFSGDWTRYQVSSTTSAYSSMIIQKDGNIGFVYEENEQSYGTGGYDIMYQSLSLATITSNKYSIDSSVGVPTFTNESGNYENSVTVEISSVTDGANIYYTLDGTEPTTKSTAYTGPFSLTETTTVKAIAVNEECFFSSVSEVEYTIVQKTTPVDPTLSLSATTTTLTVGETAQLTVGTNSDGAVSYTSSNTAVATVDGNGKVTAVGAGTATITASVAATEQYNAASATVTITVNAATPTFSLSATTTTLTVGETVQLTVETNSDGAVSYTSSNTAVATVDATGKVTAVAAGTATITATVAATDAYTEKSATITFTVTQPETPVTPVAPTINLTAATNTLTVGGTTQLTLTTNSDGAVTYTSSNTSVATVNANGVVTAVAAGSATITASVAATSQYNAASATVTITVNKVNATISLSAATATLTAGETTQLTATTNSDGAVTYTSSNTSVATVNDNGVVTAVAAGTVTITANVAATTKYTAASATCEITVNAQAAKSYTLKPLTGLIGTTTFNLVTFSATEAVSLPSGVKAYYVKETDDAGAKLTRLSGSVVPANTGVILLAENSGDITLTETTATGSAVTGNLLVGTFDEDYPRFSVSTKDYILAVKGSGELKDKFAFCQLTEGYQLTGDSYANRAYLSLPLQNSTFATRSITLSFDDEEGGTTAIDEVESPVDAPAEYYTLQGVKVEADQLTPGIYIMKHHGKTRKVVF